MIDTVLTSFHLTASTGILKSLSFTPTSLVVGALTSVMIDFSLANPLLAGSSIQVSFPLWNPQANSTLQLPLIQGPYLCNAVLGFSNSTSCLFQNNTLYLSNINPSSSLPSLSQLKVNVTGFRNPRTTSPLTGLKVMTFNSDGGSVD